MDPKIVAARPLGNRRPLPTAFGRLTVLSCDHDNIRATLQRLRAWSESQLQAVLGEPSPDPCEAVAQLRLALVGHFGTEESEAYFGAIATGSPALIPRIAELRAEHTALLEHLHSLATQLMLERRVAFAHGMLAFAERLRVHEAIENELIGEFLHGDTD